MRKYLLLMFITYSFLFANGEELKKQQVLLKSLTSKIKVAQKKIKSIKLQVKKGGNKKKLLPAYKKYSKISKNLKKQVNAIKSKIADLLLKPEDIKKLEEINKSKQLKNNFAKVLTAKKCADCHKKEFSVWKKTPHHMTFKSLHKNKNAKKIQKRLKLKGSIKRNGMCVQCHYTQVNQRGKGKAISGVSCESCHGAGKDWIDIHNNKKVPKVKRRKDAAAKGMNNPSDIYLIAQNCYQCHSIPNEKLVNIGGHQAGSSFEFVKWSQGIVRHNFVRTGNKSNAETDKKRLRIMFVTGAMLDLEYSIRGLSLATKRGKYYSVKKKKSTIAYRRLLQIQKMAKIVEVNELLTLFKALNFNNRADLKKAADYITLKAQSFTQSNDGSKLAVLDSLLPKKTTYK